MGMGYGVGIGQGKEIATVHIDTSITGWLKADWLD